MEKRNCRNTPNCLRKYRKVRGLTQKEVAQVLGLNNTSMVSRWENGVCIPKTINLFKLAILYRVLIDALFIDLIRVYREEIYKKEKQIFNSNKEIEIND